MAGCIPSRCIPSCSLLVLRKKKIPLWREAVPDWRGEPGQHLSGGREGGNGAHRPGPSCSDRPLSVGAL